MSTDSKPASSHAGSQPGGGWTPPTVEHLQALLPQYEITAMLGHGGMGAVYKGRQKSLDRVVAIKILPPGLENSDAKFVERFQNEARTMAKLMHPGIVAVFDFGETAEGQLYFVMEYVDGTDVAKMIQSSGKLPQDYALAITAHVCDALAYAHGFGVVHRDIKPANILINMQGQIKVADFGLAKADDPARTSGLTKTGYAMGTPDYVSPEALIMGSSIDGRADLYAIGVMLYQMLTGEIPRGLFQMPNVRTKGETDPRFDAIISKAMQTDRESRYQTAGELRKALDVILTTPHIKQDASKAVAAVPQQAVNQTPGKRSAVAAKPAAKGPKPPQGGADTPGRPSSNPPRSGADHDAGRSARAPLKKSNVGLWLGIAAAAVVVIGGVVFMFSGGKPDVARPSKVENSPATGSTLESRATPIKVAEPSKPTAGSQAASTTSDGWTDGLAEWIAKPGNVSGGIMQEEAGAWRIVKGASVQFGPTTPGSFLANVAVRVTIRDMGNKHFGINLRGQGSAKGGHQAGFESSGRTGIFLETEGAKRTELGSFKTPAGFVVGPRHVMEFRAEGDVLTTIVDGQTTGSVRDATFSSGRISIVGLDVLIEKIEYRDLGSAPATPVVAGASSDGWIDGIAEHLAERANAARSNNLLKEGDAWRYKGPEAISLGAKLTPPRVAANVAVRYSVRFDSEKSAVHIILRTQKAAGSFYQVTVYGSGVAGIALSKGGQRTELAGYPIPAGFDETAAHLIEFRAEGDKLTLLVDGVERGSVNDSTYASGGFSVTGGLIDKIEYRDLGSAPAPPIASSAPSATSDGWIDGLSEWLALPGNATKKTLQKEGDGWRYKGPESIGLGARLSPPDKLANVAVRLTSKGGGGAIALRDQGGAGNHYLALQAHPGFEIRRGQNSKYTTLAKFKLPPGFKQGDSYVMEFRAEGDLLTLIVNGQTLGSIKDSTYSSGRFHVSPLYALIEKLEYRDLGGPVSPSPAALVSPRGSAVSSSPATATQDAPFVNTLGMKFVPVPVTGGPASRQRVLFGVWLTRVQDYAAYAAANPQADGSWKTQEREGVPAGRELDHPVVGVNWEDAQAFCKWLTEKESAEGKLPKGLKYRLPSDEEWSWAVGLPPELGGTPAEKSGKNGVEFPWGKGYPPKEKVVNYADEAFHAKFPIDSKDKDKEQPWLKDYNDGYATTSPVGSFPANLYGLYDMGGNVWQWCEDWFNKDQKDRVLRGGSWGERSSGYVLSSFRHRGTPDTRGIAYGFRCVLVGSAPAAAATSISSEADGGIWADALAEYFAKTTTDGRLVQEAGGARVLANGGTGFTGSRLFFTDMSLRVTARGGNEGNPIYWGALLSHGQGKAYSARVYKDGKGELHLLMPAGSGAGKVLQTFKLPAGFDYTAWHTLEFRAIGDELTFILDEVKLGSVRDSTLTGGRAPSFDGSVGGLIEKFEYKSMPKLSGSPAPDDGGGPWVDAIAEWLAVPGNVSRGTFKAEADAWRYVGPGDLFLRTKRAEEAMANMAVRVTVREMGSYNTVNLRRDDKTKTSYTFTAAKTGGAAIKLNDKTILEEFKFSPSGNASHFVFEARAEGDLLTILVNGEKIGAVRDATLTHGGFSVIPKGCLIEKIEYRELPATSPSAATNSSAIVPAAPAAAPPASAATPPDPKLAALLPNYTKAITNGLASATATDKPAFEAELARLKNNAPLPDAAEDAKLPAELKRLRGILRAQLK